MVLRGDLVSRAYIDHCESFAKKIFAPADITIVQVNAIFTVIVSLHNGFYKYTFQSELFENYASVDTLEATLKRHRKVFISNVISLLKQSIK